jgi:hypothetical protein
MASKMINGECYFCGEKTDKCVETDGGFIPICKSKECLQLLSYTFKIKK